MPSERRSPRRNLRSPRLVLFAALVAAGLALAACQSSGNDTGVVGGGGGPGGDGQSADVTMTAMNGGSAGTATLLESPQLNLSVTIRLSGSASVQEPASIQPGTCAKPAPPPTFLLSPVQRGTSTTNTLNNTTLATLESSPYVIVIARSALDPTIVSCGVVPQVPASSGS